VDDETDRPVSSARYEVVDAQGTVIAQGRTDWQGGVRHRVPSLGQYTVRIVADAPAS
jgi:hypothetical protein